MKLIDFPGRVGLIVLITAFITQPEADHRTLEIGAAAPDFLLRGVDGKMYSLASFKKAEVLVVVFTCNHCPTAQAYEDRLIKMTVDYANRNVAVVAIMPNDPTCLRLDELDFSDLGDSYEEMKIRAKEKKFNFPYLYDGKSELVSRTYGPVATPHVFIFDKERRLRYQGRVDDMESPFKTPVNTDARNAIDALLKNQEVPVKTTKVFGCSIKWSEKKGLVEKTKDAWAKESVHLVMIDADGVKSILKNSSGKLCLIHIWSIRSKTSMQEFPDLITINRMYRDRDFEFISISTDSIDFRDQVLQFLKLKQASNPNYLSQVSDRNKWVKEVNLSWQGSLPFTMLIEPEGKILYSKEGLIDPANLKRMIVNNHLLGRFP